jgi:hypothetical protein
MVALTGELGEPPDRILDLWRLDELRGIAVDGDAISLGALTTYTDIRRSAVCREHLPVLVEAAATIGAAQIQNRGTLGGNVVNASPAGDTLPVLLAADATFVLGSAGGERTVRASEFWPAYRRTALEPDELLLRIRDNGREGLSFKGACHVRLGKNAVGRGDDVVNDDPHVCPLQRRAREIGIAAVRNVERTACQLLGAATADGDVIELDTDLLVPAEFVSDVLRPLRRSVGHHAGRDFRLRLGCG